jgi:hypothetical protein
METRCVHVESREPAPFVLGAWPDRLSGIIRHSFPAPLSAIAASKFGIYLQSAYKREIFGQMQADASPTLPFLFLSP